MTAEKIKKIKTEKSAKKLMIDYFVGPKCLFSYLNLMRSGVVDCGSLICSFVDSSSERDATYR